MTTKKNYYKWCAGTNSKTTSSFFQKNRVHGVALRVFYFFGKLNFHTSSPMQIHWLENLYKLSSQLLRHPKLLSNSRTQALHCNVFCTCVLSIIIEEIRGFDTISFSKLRALCHSCSFRLGIRFYCHFCGPCRVLRSKLRVVLSPVKTALNLVASLNPDSNKASCTLSCKACFFLSFSNSYAVGSRTSFFSLYTTSIVVGDSCHECTTMVLRSVENHFFPCSQ